MNSANNILETFIPLGFFFPRHHFNSDDFETRVSPANPCNECGLSEAAADSPRKSCVSVAVSSRLDRGPRASDDTCNNDRSSWQLPRQRLVTQPPTVPRRRIVIQLANGGARCSTAGLTGIIIRALITKVRPSRPPLIADRSPLLRPFSLVHRRRSSQAKTRGDTPRDTPRKLGLYGFPLLLSGHTL